MTTILTCLKQDQVMFIHIKIITFRYDHRKNKIYWPTGIEIQCNNWLNTWQAAAQTFWMIKCGSHDVEYQLSQKYKVYTWKTTHCAKRQYPPGDHHASHILIGLLSSKCCVLCLCSVQIFFVAKWMLHNVEWNELLTSIHVLLNWVTSPLHCLQITKKY